MDTSWCENCVSACSALKSGSWTFGRVAVPDILLKIGRGRFVAFVDADKIACSEGFGLVSFLSRANADPDWPMVGFGGPGPKDRGAYAS